LRHILDSGYASIKVVFFNEDKEALYENLS